MSTRLCRIAILLVAVLCASTASAAFNFTSQARSVFGTCYGNLGSVSNTITAPNLGLFDQTVNVSHPTYGGGATAHQRSELLPDAITITGNESVFRPAMVGTGIAEATSLTTIGFTLSTPTEVALTASGVISGQSPFSARTVALNGPGTSINWSVGNTFSGFPWETGSRSTTALLAPGTYQFTVNMGSVNTSITQNNVSVSSFNVALTIPEPGSFGLAMILFPGMIGRRRVRT